MESLLCVYWQEEGEDEGEGEGEEFYSDEDSVSGSKRKRRDEEVSCWQLLTPLTQSPSLSASVLLRGEATAALVEEKEVSSRAQSPSSKPVLPSPIQRGDTLQVL